MKTIKYMIIFMEIAYYKNDNDGGEANGNGNANANGKLYVCIVAKIILCSFANSLIIVIRRYSNYPSYFYFYVRILLI